VGRHAAFYTTFLSDDAKKRFKSSAKGKDGLNVCILSD
jgi:hypothetical protein